MVGFKLWRGISQRSEFCDQGESQQHVDRHSDPAGWHEHSYPYALVRSIQFSSKTILFSTVAESGADPSRSSTAIGVKAPKNNTQKSMCLKALTVSNQP